MKVELVTRAYDDDGKECKEGDVVLIQTKEIEEPARGRIQKIHTRAIVFVFDDPIIGYTPQKIRLEDIVSAELQ